MSIFSDDLNNDLDHIKKIKNILRLSTVLLTLVLVTSIVFLYKYYSIATQTSLEIKNKVEQSAKQAAAKKEMEVKDTYEKKLAAQAANPWQSYKTEDMFGAITISFPKNWKTNIKKDLGSSVHLSFWADPDYVVYDLKAEETYTALRVLVIDRKYEEYLKEYQNRNKYNKKYEITEVTLAGINGSKFDWTNPDTEKKSTFILVPYRDKVLFVGTDDVDKYGPIYQEILGKLVLNK